MNTQKTAESLVRLLGGTKNIVNLTHCMTRLRFTLRESEKVSIPAVEKIEGVRGVATQGGVFQVIIGTDVDILYKELTEKYITTRDGAGEVKKQGVGNRILELISSTLSPLIPVIMGAAFLTIILSLLSQFGVLTSEMSSYKVLAAITDCVYYFFPVLIAISLSARLKVNQMFAVATACFLLFPTFTALFNGGEVIVTLFGLPIKYAVYNKQIIPVFLSVICQKYIEKLVFKWMPKPLRTMVGSGLVLTLTVAVTVLVLGPAGAIATEWINMGIYFIVDNMGWAAVPVIAFINPILLGTGLGSANFPIMLSSYIANGYEALILPAALAGNAAQVGAGFAIALKSKNKELKAVSSEAAVTALMGVTEPIIFSVHYRLKRTLIAVMIAGGVAAILPGITHVACYALATGVLSLPAYLPGGNFNMIMACLSMVLGIACGFAAVWVIGFEDPKEDGDERPVDNAPVPSALKTQIKVMAPVAGKLISLEHLADKAFLDMGQGVAIVPEEDTVVSPVSGRVTAVSKTKHAIAVTTEDGAEILIHVGLNTVDLNGAYFKLLVEKNTQVKVGDKLLRFDREKIAAAGCDVTTPVLMTNCNLDFALVVAAAEHISAGELLFTAQ